MMMARAQQTLQPAIFRAYDIRGVVDETLTTEGVYAIGKAVGSIAHERGEKRVAVGRDGRLSGPLLLQALCEGILSTGCDVINLGMVPTPLLYYATYMLETTSGVMLTGSHNPPEYNGLKIVVRHETLANGAITNLYHQIMQGQLSYGAGDVRELDIIERYINHVCYDVKLKRPLKVVVDCGNGVAGGVVSALYRQLGCEVHELYCNIDGSFPNHHPDPSIEQNLHDLIHKVRQVKADIGLAFDGDGDRLGVVTNQGTIIWPDRQLMLFAQSILQKHPGAKIIYDVKCTHHLAPLIEQLGGQPIMWKTGHSLIKEKLAETQAMLAGEMSGHIFIKDRWYGFDDAIYAGARLLEILAATSLTCDDLFNAVPNSINTPELKIYVEDDQKFQLIAQVIAKADFPSAKSIVTIDGLRANFDKGWGLVRASNTTPCLVLRFEAENEDILKHIQQLFRDLLLAVNSQLIMPF